MQDAIAQHTLALAEKEEEQAARQSVLQSASSGVPRGSLPNLFLGSYGNARLLAHPRYIPLPAHDCATSQAVSDDLLPSIPQRTPLWYQARQGAVTASTAALFLGMLEPKTSKQLASCGLHMYATEGHARLLQALAEMRSAERAVATDRGPFAACAMAMGTLKEHDVILTYLQHMDEQKEWAATPLTMLELFAALCTPRQKAVTTLKNIMLLSGAAAEGCMRWAQRCWTPYLKLSRCTRWLALAACRVSWRPAMLWSRMRAQVAHYTHPVMIACVTACIAQLISTFFAMQVPSCASLKQSTAFPS